MTAVDDVQLSSPAADAAGNLGAYSTIADATTPAAPAVPPGLVGGLGV